jgi:nucleotide-binding universal stress UspA family protein
MGDCILVPVDGSANSDRAVRFAIEQIKLSGGALHLLNVQLPLGGAIRSFIRKADIDAYHREEGEQALVSAVRIATEAGIAPETHIVVGRPGTIVADFARRLDPRMVVMGTRGHTGLAGMLLGSVAQDVIAHCTAPVCLVK